MIVDIKEGAHDFEMPLCGHGKVLSRPDLDEHYITSVKNGIRTFCAVLTIGGRMVYRFSEWERPEVF